MKISVTVLFLLALFCISYLITYRRRFQINPQKTSRYAFGIALNAVASAMLIISLLSIIITTFPWGLLWGVGHIFLFLGTLVAVFTKIPMKKIIAPIFVLAFVTSLVFSVFYAVIPFYSS